MFACYSSPALLSFRMLEVGLGYVQQPDFGGQKKTSVN